MIQVKAAYKYQAEDVDELNFEVGEIIQVKILHLLFFHLLEKSEI
jgi:hypothetical protein